MWRCRNGRGFAGEGCVMVQGGGRKSSGDGLWVEEDEM